jgi:hypothetical protein
MIFFNFQIFRYNSGYFYPINSLIACPLIQDLVEKFGGKSESFEEKDLSMPNATFYFSHSEAVLPFLRLLGLYRYSESRLMLSLVNVIIRLM